MLQPHTQPKPRDDVRDDLKDVVVALRRSIRRIEEPAPACRLRLPLGIPEFDEALPGGGLRMGCVHEIGGDEAATAFCAVLLARAGARGGSLLWLARGENLYPPGLVRYGIEPGRLLLVSGLSRPADMVWAMEEALRCRALKGVVAELGAVGLAASRRLMLTAEGSGVLGLALVQAVDAKDRKARVPTAASRWRITSMPTVSSPTPTGDNISPEKPKEVGRTRWRAALLRCRSGGRPVEHLVSWGAGGWHAAASARGTLSVRYGIDATRQSA